MGCISSRPTGTNAKYSEPGAPPPISVDGSPPPKNGSPSAATGRSAASNNPSSRKNTLASPGSLSSKKSSLTQNVVVENIDKDIRDIYEIEDMPTLGSGISGQVKVCVHKTTGLEYALKALSKRALKADSLERMKEEIRCMAYLDHPNILRLNEYFESKNVIYLVMELCKGGELLDRLQAQQGHHYSEQVACRYVHTMLSSIAYCHANGIVHRDLKLENFLFETEEDDSELKLIDFGLSQYFEDDTVLHNAVGTPYYVAPEVMQGNYDAKCDVWSIGVIAYMLLSGTPPFHGRSDAETLAAVKGARLKFEEGLFSHISMHAKDFITQCLNRNYQKRITASEALEHAWFSIQRENRFSEPAKSAKLVDRMDKYIRRTSLAKIIMDVVAHTLLPEQIADLRAQFAKFDVSNTGDITVSDLRTMLSHMEAEGGGGQGEKFVGTLEQIFAGVDVNETGKISYHEFIAATISRQHVTEENLTIAFERMSNHNDTIIRDDIEELLGETSHNVDDILAEVGLLPTHEINFEQFKAIMNGSSPSGCATPNSVHSARRASGVKDHSKGLESPAAESVTPRLHLVSSERGSGGSVGGSAKIGGGSWGGSGGSGKMGSGGSGKMGSGGSGKMGSGAGIGGSWGGSVGSVGSGKMGKKGGGSPRHPFEQSHTLPDMALPDMEM